MSHDRKVEILRDGKHYASEFALVIRQTVGNENTRNIGDEETTLQIRRVIRQDITEELQLEINIIKFGKKRNTTVFSSFIMTPEIADELAKACLELRK